MSLTWTWIRQLFSGRICSETQKPNLGRPTEEKTSGKKNVPLRFPFKEENTKEIIKADELFSSLKYFRENNFLFTF